MRDFFWSKNPQGTFFFKRALCQRITHFVKHSSKRRTCTIVFVEKLPDSFDKNLQTKIFSKEILNSWSFCKKFPKRNCMTDFSDRKIRRINSFGWFCATKFLIFGSTKIYRKNFLRRNCEDLVLFVRKATKKETVWQILLQ